MRKNIFLLLIIVMVTVLGFSKTAFSRELTQVSIMMNWFPHIDFAPFVLGKDMGFYTEEGLDVKIISGKGSIVSTKMVATDKVSFAIANATTTLVARERGLPIKSILCFYQINPICLFFVEDGRIRVPKDLEGKSISSYPKSMKRRALLCFLKKNGLNIEKVDIISVAKEVEIPLFVSGKVDAVMAYFCNKPKIRLRKQEFDVGRFLFHDFGIVSLSQTFITNEKTMKEKPQLVRKVAKATLRSWKYAIAHPEEAIKALIKCYPVLNKEEELACFKDAIPFMKSKTTETHGFGFMSKEDWQQTQDTLIESGQMERRIDVQDVFTNKFRR